MIKHRVLHFMWGGTIGGPTRALFQLAKEEMARDEWDVGVAFGHAEGIYAEAIKDLGCDVIDLQMRTGADIPSALRALPRLREFDIHHFHAVEPSLLVASARCGEVTRVLTHRHGAYIDAESPSRRLRRAVGGVLLRKYLHAVSGNTEYATRYAVARYRLQRLPNRVTYNGIDFSLLAPSRERQEVRSELGAGQNGFIVGSTGTLKREKRFDRLVALLDTNAPLRVVLVGDGPLRHSLETQAASLRAEDRLKITGLRDSVTDHVQAMDVFVLPSSGEESFGNAVVEAMALGIPSIVFSDSPGLCEHIESGVTGFIVDDQVELASLVERLRLDADLRVRVGSAGAEHVRAKYSLENMHDSYRSLYETALGGCPRSHQ